MRSFASRGVAVSTPLPRSILLTILVVDFAAPSLEGSAMALLSFFGVLADEPADNLDSKLAKSLVNLIRQLNRENGRTFVIATHGPVVVGAA